MKTVYYVSSNIVKGGNRKEGKTIFLIYKERYRRTERQGTIVVIKRLYENGNFTLTLTLSRIIFDNFSIVHLKKKERKRKTCFFCVRFYTRQGSWSRSSFSMYLVSVSTEINSFVPYTVTKTFGDPKTPVDIKIEMDYFRLIILYLVTRTI